MSWTKDPPRPDASIEQLAQFIGHHLHLSTFLHHLKSLEIANNILNNGFEFENHLGYTTDQVSGYDLIELVYVRSLRKAYGNIVLVIQIADVLINRINASIQHTHSHFSEALTKKEPFFGDNELPIFTLPEQHILGYFNMDRSEGTRNNKFNPEYVCDTLSANISKIIRKG